MLQLKVLLVGVGVALKRIIAPFMLPSKPELESAWEQSREQDYHA